MAIAEIYDDWVNSVILSLISLSHFGCIEGSKNYGEGEFEGRR